MTLTSFNLTEEELDRELYMLVNNIEYHGHNYEDYQEEITELENKIHLIKTLSNF